MHVLVTNDDGFFAPGLAELAASLASLGHRVTVIAPETNWSGKSQSIVFERDLTARRFHDAVVRDAFILDAAPADCVRVAEALTDAPLDLVAVGVNHGANIGRDVYRSATVGAAREAVLRGHPALALSAVHGRVEPETLTFHLPRLMDLALRRSDVIVNVNLPVRSLSEPVMAVLADQAIAEIPEAQPTDRSEALRITMRRVPTGTPAPETDVALIAEKRVSVVFLSASMKEAAPLPA